MSYFVFIAIPLKIQNLEKYFALPLQLHEVSQTPIGLVTRGNKKSSISFIVTVQGHSSYLLDKGNSKHKYSHLLKDSVTKLLEEVPSVSFLIHWAKGYLDSEKLSLTKKKLITHSQFIKQFPDFEEDVRYVILNSPPGDIADLLRKHGAKE